ncbi:acyltransferase [Microbacterium sp. 4R-513]|uniref:acyltransferase family protein n=1 Tax=Microbacterium sp. 4R-513 TaxID=2567934 RepID=UPI0013E1D9DF|nr:acyltransferase [Microbacterium sp. 4R-513]QIG38558.1 acyltransferase [Microbacterium sp. 4R-513]
MTVPAARARLGWADLVRGAAIICVVYFHATLFLGAIGIDDTLGRVKAVFELFPLPAFFLMAGVFGARGILEWDFRTLAARRLLPLVYVYVLWSLLRFALFTAFPALPSRDTDIPPADPLSLVLLPVLPASLYWFLYALALFMLVAWTVRRMPRGLVVGGALVVSGLFTSGLVNTHTIAWNRIGALFFFFVVGVFLAEPLKRGVARANVSALLVAAGGFVVVAGTLVVFRSLLRVPLLVTLGQCLAVAVAILLAKYAARASAFDVVQSIGRASLPIYLVHIFAIAPLAFALGLLQPDWPAAVNIAVTFAVTAIAILCGFGLARLATIAPWLLMPALRTRAPVGPAATRAS